MRLAACLMAFGLVFLSPPARAEPDCSPGGIATARAAFRTAFDARDFAGARGIIAPLDEECVQRRALDPRMIAEIRSDFASVAQRLGEDALCLDMLLDYARPRGETIAGSASLPAPLRRAISQTMAQCRARACTTDGVIACAALRANEQRAALSRAGYESSPCSLDVAEAVTGLRLPNAGREPRCLVMLPPLRAADDPRDRETGDPAELCPRLSVARMGAGNAVRQDPVALPARAFLNDTGLCCNAVSMGIARDGRIAVRPADNPPFHCVTGRLADVQEDIVVLRGARLVLLRSRGWRAPPGARR